MDYQHGWEFLDSATETQMSPRNEAKLDRLALEAAALWRLIPDPRPYSFNGDDDGDDRDFPDDDGETQDDPKLLWGQIEAIEELLALSGARFRRNNEHFNEDERRMDYQDNSCARY